MKGAFILMSPGLVALLVGCSTTPVALAPVGPNPLGSKGPSAKGELQVFSSLAEQSDDQNQGSTDPAPLWYQHTDYNIYDQSGKLVKHVGNTIGHYEQAPRRVTLPAGRYLVKARAKDYLRVEVPVTIEPGRTTRIHLDDNWKPAADTPNREWVSLPNGNPVGWRAESTKELGSN
jgi:hypothetical protein